MIETLKAYREKTGVASVALLKNQRDCPENLTPRHIQSWLEGRLRTAPQEHLAYVLKKWEALPVLEFGIITEDILDVIKGHWNRTRVGPNTLLKDAADKPEGLRPHIIAAWLNARSRSYRKDHLKYVLERWSAMPGALNTKRVLSGYVEITQAQRERLHELKAKTGFGPQVLMRGAKDAPPGLGSDKIKAWIDGTIKTAKPEQLAYVFARWEAHKTQK
ncbi:MAG TPA: hypothetical protein DEA55_05305 [Rhodospirillaceae bacterium]|nr:hypothetical protein [Rhodospirillaceae bacterium]